jgi:hypothetical protein
MDQVQLLLMLFDCVLCFIGININFVKEKQWKKMIRTVHTYWSRDSRPPEGNKNLKGKLQPISGHEIHLQSG